MSNLCDAPESQKPVKNLTSKRLIVAEWENEISSVPVLCSVTKNSAPLRPANAHESTEEIPGGTGWWLARPWDRVSEPGGDRAVDTSGCVLNNVEDLLRYLLQDIGAGSRAYFILYAIPVNQQATGWFKREGDRQIVSTKLTAFNLLREDAQREGLNATNCRSRIIGVRQDAGESRYLGQEHVVEAATQPNLKVHAAPSSAARPRFATRFPGTKSESQQDSTQPRSSQPTAWHDFLRLSPVAGGRPFTFHPSPSPFARRACGNSECSRNSRRRGP